MSTRAKKTIESNNDSDIEELSEAAGEENENDDEDEEEPEEKPTTKKKIGPGSGMLHLLPIQFNIDNNTSTKANVDAFFEPFIKENKFKAKDSNICPYTSTLRGHPLNGKKHTNIKGLTYYQLVSDNNQSIYEVNQSKSISEYFLWQYDDPYVGSNPLNNIKQTMSKLDILS